MFSFFSFSILFCLSELFFSFLFSTESILEVIPALMSLVAVSYLAPLIQWFMSKVFFSFSLSLSLLSSSCSTFLRVCQWGLLFFSEWSSKQFFFVAVVGFCGSERLNFSLLFQSFFFLFLSSFFFVLCFP